MGALSCNHDTEKGGHKETAKEELHIPFEFWVEDVLGPLTVAKAILATSVLVLGVSCTVFEACQLGTGIWVGVLMVICALFGLLAVRNPHSQGFFVAYLMSSVVACVSACVLAYVTGVETIFNALQIKYSVSNADHTVAAQDAPAAFIGVAALNGILLSLSIGFIICATICCMRMCMKIREPDPCCQRCVHEDFPGPVVYMSMGGKTKQDTAASPNNPDLKEPGAGRRRSKSR